MTRRCSLCQADATEPFALCGIQGFACPDHAKGLAKAVTKFVAASMAEQRRRSREAERELIPNNFRRTA